MIKLKLSELEDDIKVAFKHDWTFAITAGELKKKILKFGKGGGDFFKVHPLYTIEYSKYEPNAKNMLHLYLIQSENIQTDKHYSKIEDLIDEDKAKNLVTDIQKLLTNAFEDEDYMSWFWDYKQEVEIDI